MTRRSCQIVSAALLALGCSFVLMTSVEFQMSAQTPASGFRAEDGKPDLTGLWYRGRNMRGTSSLRSGFTNQTEADGDIVRLFPSRRCAPNQIGCRDNTNQSNDGEFTGRTGPNRPLYRPEHWDKVQYLDYDTNFSDPMFRCYPEGVPRVGVPLKIVQTENEAVFFYSRLVRDHDYRVVPIDGREHDPDWFPGFYGDPVGHWEGDTLVVDTVGFNDIGWLTARGGYFHSYELRVIERFRRDGDTLHYQVTVEDPEVLLEPWMMNAQVVRLNADPTASIPEGVPCHDYDEAVTVSRIRH